MSSKTPTLAKLVKQIGRKKLEAYLKVFFIDLNELLGLKQPLNARQIDDLAFRIAENYRNLNIADINCILERVKNGHYGQMYDRLTIPGVMKWFSSYFEERCLTAAEINRRKAENGKHPFPNAQRGHEITRAEFKKASDYYERQQTQKDIDQAKKKMK